MSSDQLSLLRVENNLRILPEPMCMVLVQNLDFEAKLTRSQYLNRFCRLSQSLNECSKSAVFVYCLYSPLVVIFTKVPSFSSTQVNA